MRIVLTGAGGQLASDLIQVLQHEEVIALTHRDLDICDAPRVERALVSIRPDTVVNTAAFHRVDECETEIHKAFRVNVYGVRNLALACKEVGAALVQIGTDYVFDGKKTEPYAEDDSTCPLNIYGVSKLAGELVIRATLSRFYIVRSSGLYGAAGVSGKGGNFVQTMLRLAAEGREIQVVDDQRLSPTYTVDLAAKIAWLIRTDHFGILHITNSDHCTWYGFAKKIFQLVGLKPKLSPTSSVTFGAKAQRPAFSVLRHCALERLGADDIRPWPAALRAYLEQTGVI